MTRIEKERLTALMVEFKRYLQSHQSVHTGDLSLLYEKFFNVIYGRKELDLFPGFYDMSFESYPISLSGDSSYLDDVARGELIYDRINNRD